MAPLKYRNILMEPEKGNTFWALSCTCLYVQWRNELCLSNGVASMIMGDELKGTRKKELVTYLVIHID